MRVLPTAESLTGGTSTILELADEVDLGRAAGPTVGCHSSLDHDDPDSISVAGGV